MKRKSLMSKVQADLFEFYQKNQDKFVKMYNNQSIVIKGNKVVAVAENEWKAYKEVREKLKSGTYIIQRVTPGPEAFTVSISPAIIN